MNKIILTIIFVFVFFLAFFRFEGIETSFINAFCIKNSAGNTNLSNVLSLSNKKLHVIFEGASEEDLENQVHSFPLKNLNFSNHSEYLINLYKNYPINSLSPKTRELLIENKYQEIRKQGYENIYNPTGILISSPIVDPYGFSTDFVKSIIPKKPDIKSINRKFYTQRDYFIDSQSDIKTAYDYSKNKNIYLTGAPIHSYINAKSSEREINIIAFLSTVGLLLLVKFYLKSSKYFLPIVLSIAFGVITGFCFSVLIYKKIHILTLVFSTSIVGISLDYSIHSFLSDNKKEFFKNLTSSMVTTAACFLTLLLTNIRLLQEIAVFTAFGLFGVYLFVLNILPKFNPNTRSFSINIKNFKPFLIILCSIVFLYGYSKLSFDDNIQNLYKPPQKLMNSELFANKIFPEKQPYFIIVTGNSTEEILQKEENLNIEDKLSLSNFVSSKKRQEENINLVKGLYKKDLFSYANFLNNAQKYELLNSKNKIYDIEKCPLKNIFSIGKNQSYIITYRPYKNSINIEKELSNNLIFLRHKFFKILPLALSCLYLFSIIFWGIKQGTKIILPSIIGAIFSVSSLCIAGHGITIFNLLATLLIIGFSLDYSIFLSSKEPKREEGVIISACSTLFSFLMLSFTSFYPIKTISLTIFIGVLISFLFSLAFFKENQTI